MRPETIASTNGVANRVVIAVLKRRAGRRLGRRLAVVEYAGPSSGRGFRLVTLYRTDGQPVRIRVAMAQRKTWWRNFRAAHPVRLRLAGRDHDAMAQVVYDGDRMYVVANLDR